MTSNFLDWVSEMINGLSSSDVLEEVVASAIFFVILVILTRFRTRLRTVWDKLAPSVLVGAIERLHGSVQRFKDKQFSAMSAAELTELITDHPDRIRGGFERKEGGVGMRPGKWHLHPDLYGRDRNDSQVLIYVEESISGELGGLENQFLDASSAFDVVLVTPFLSDEARNSMDQFGVHHVKPQDDFWLVFWACIHNYFGWLR